MRFLATKLELLEAHLVRLEEQLYKVQSQICALQYELQQKEWEKINNNHYRKCFNDQFSDTLGSLRKLGE